MPNLIVSCVSVAIAFIPEGLPIALTAGLTITANLMRKQKVLCKSLKTVETLGSVSVICSDKTGTLTQNKMHVEDISVFDSQFTPQTFLEAVNKSPQAAKENINQVAAVSAICNAAVLGGDAHDDDGDEKRERLIIGDATGRHAPHSVSHIPSQEKKKIRL